MKLQIRHPHPLPPALAFRRWRDELVQRAAGLPHVRTLHEPERREDGEKLFRVVECCLDLEVPLVARPFLPKDALLLELAEQLDERALACTWTLRSRGLPQEAVRASGLLRFDDGLLLVEGEALVDPGVRPQIPPALARR